MTEAEEMFYNDWQNAMLKIEELKARAEKADRQRDEYLARAIDKGRELSAALKECAEMRAALEHIARYPIHSEPMGGALDMQDIAYKALEALKGDRK